MICYIAYPTSLTLQSANALQTYSTLRELRIYRPDTLALMPRWGREPSRFADLGVVHLPRVPIGKLSRLYRSMLLYYLEHSAFAWMCAALVAQHNALARVTNPARRIQAVYVRQTVCAAWWSAVFGPRLGIPVIYEAHDFEAWQPSRAKESWAQGLLLLMDRAALTRSAAVVSLTNDFRHFLATNGWREPDEVFVIPDAYDADLFAPQDRIACRTALGLPLDARVLVYAGMTFAYRWIDGLLDAVAQLAVSYPQLLLMLVGGRPAERLALQQQARAAGLDLLFRTGSDSDAPMLVNAPLQRPTVLLVEPRPQAEIVRYLGSADVLVIPDTVTDLTASPLKLFEYLALGQPVVLPDLPALREIVPDAVGRFFPRRNLAGLTHALALALDAGTDPAGTLIRQSLAQQHTYKRRAERILTLVDQVAAR